MLAIGRGQESHGVDEELACRAIIRGNGGSLGTDSEFARVLGTREFRQTVEFRVCARFGHGRRWWWCEQIRGYEYRGPNIALQPQCFKPEFGFRVASWKTSFTERPVPSGRGFSAWCRGSPAAEA